MDRETIYASLSPNEEWSLAILGPSADAAAFYAMIQRKKSRESYAFPFGIGAAAEEFQVQWGLPKDVCGLFVAQKCYWLFYYGVNQRRKPRYRARLSAKRPFSAEAIADFGKEDVIQHQTWEGVYPVPDLRLGKCAWCRTSPDSFWVVVFEGVVETTEVQSEVVCSQCAKVAPAFIKMRKEGYSRKLVLIDFGFRR